MSTKSKQKGAKFERDVCTILTKSLGKEFKRVPLSGSLEYLKGDVWCPTDTNFFPFCVECKHHREIPFNNLLTAKTSPIWEFWTQTIREAKVMDKAPLLVFKWDRSKVFCAFVTSAIKVSPRYEVVANGSHITICLLDDFLAAYKKGKL